LVAFASSLDQIGPITKKAEDAQIVFQAIAGRDERDATSVESKISNFKPACRTGRPACGTGRPACRTGRPACPSGRFPVSNLKIGVPKEYFIEGINKEVEKIIKNAIKKIEELGAKIEEISLPHTKYALPVYYLIATSEASANLARYDGIKYGLSKGEEENLLDVYLQSRGKGFGQEVKRRIILGTYALSSGYYDAYYLKAQKVRTLIKEDFEKAFDKVDVIFTPTSPFPAFKLGEKIDDPLLMYLADIFTVSVNLVGLPAVSLPVGVAEKGMPVGLQIIGKEFEENKILDIAKLLEF
jgi:aspartyl-tRNA(Asn)/glutamyl-tRNA(Gln) amidotransferase subunit A